MKILSVVILPTKHSAVERMAWDNKKYNPHLDIDIVPVHPKRPSKLELETFYAKAQEADIIDFQYWKSAVMLLKRFPVLKRKCLTLTHHNPYDIFQSDWADFNAVIANNQEIQEQIEGSWLIHNSVDLNEFKFNFNYTNEKKVLMVAFRIEGKKGIREVAEVCKELGYKFTLVGHISRPEYFKQFKDRVDFRPDISEDELKWEYHTSAVLVSNSIDDYESGPLPVMEAMACGVPVLTRNYGIVPELYDGENMVVRIGEQEDKEDLRNELMALMENRERREEMRIKAYRTIIQYSAEKRARLFAEMWNKVFYREIKQPLVSVIIPTHNNKKQVLEIIDAINEQTYQNIEIVICDDNSNDGTEKAIIKARPKSRFPIKYINTKRDGYNLAMARNMGAIEASGEALVFLDSRLKPRAGAISRLTIPILKDLSNKIWTHGNKGGQSNFVENFAAIGRKNFIKAGMCNERIDRYGGMTQEIKKRFKAQGYKFQYIDDARADEIKTSRSKKTRLYDIYKSKLKLFKMYREK